MKTYNDAMIIQIPVEYKRNVLKIMEKFMTTEQTLRIILRVEFSKFNSDEIQIYADDITKQEESMLNAIGYAYYMGALNEREDTH